MSCSNGCSNGGKGNSEEEAKFQAEDTSSELAKKDKTPTGDVPDTSTEQRTRGGASGNPAGSNPGGAGGNLGGASGGVSISLPKPDKGYISSRENYEEFRNLLPSSVLRFNPNNSSGLFIGVGCQKRNPKLKSKDPDVPSDLGKPAVKDCIRMQHLADDTLGIPKSNTQLLTSERLENQSIDEPLPDATHKDTILDQIKTYSSKAESDGIFMLHFSCHGDRMQLHYSPTELVLGGIPISYDGILIPYDYSMKDRRFINCNMILSALEQCRAKAVLITLDACHSSSIAKELCRAATHLPLYVYAACSETERSVSWHQLGHGIFTHLAASYIEEHGEHGLLHVRCLQDHLSPSFNVLNNLHKEGFPTGVTEMNPDGVLSSTVPKPSGQMHSAPKSKKSPQVHSLTSQSSLIELEKMRLEHVREEVLKVGTSPNTNMDRIVHYASEWLDSKKDTLCEGSLKREKLESLLPINEDFQITCLSYTAYSLVMHLFCDKRVAIAELTSIRVVFELWNCFVEKLPFLLHDEIANIKDAHAFCYSIHRRLVLYYEERSWPLNNEINRLQELINICNDAYMTIKSHYNCYEKESGDEKESEDEPLQPPNLDCVRPKISVPELDDVLLQQLMLL